MEIIKNHIELDNTLILNKCIELSRSPTFINTPPVLMRNMISNKNMYGNDPHTWDEFKNFVPKLLTYTELIPVTRSWLNIMTQGSQVVEHSHNKEITKYVCTYYVNNTPAHPQIEFYIDGVWKEIKTVSGDFLIFHKDLKHRVQIQTVKDLRCSITFNI